MRAIIDHVSQGQDCVTRRRTRPCTTVDLICGRCDLTVEVLLTGTFTFNGIRASTDGLCQFATCSNFIFEQVMLEKISNKIFVALW